mmetsp:Transcript_122257/g.191775  ORF Transcript_122257/g.191775 Transcript_122257/m.191775 type:complete len:243 (-) Transcript_122257:257-985(-)
MPIFPEFPHRPPLAKLAQSPLSFVCFFMSLDSESAADDLSAGLSRDFRVLQTAKSSCPFTTLEVETILSMDTGFIGLVDAGEDVAPNAASQGFSKCVGVDCSGLASKVLAESKREGESGSSASDFIGATKVDESSSFLTGSFSLCASVSDAGFTIGLEGESFSIFSYSFCPSGTEAAIPSVPRGCQNSSVLISGCVARMEGSFSFTLLSAASLFDFSAPARLESLSMTSSGSAGALSGLLAQ